MRATQPTAAGRPRHPALVLALVVSLLAAAGLVTSGVASAASPVPTTMRIDRVYSGTPIPEGIGIATPTLLAQVNDTVTIEVSFLDSTGAAASFTKDTAVVVTSNRGAFTQVTRTIDKGATSDTIDVRFPTAANQVELVVTVPAKGGASLVARTADNAATQVFDVVNELKTAPAASKQYLQQGIGGDADCQSATVKKPVCGILTLPNGAASTLVALSVGSCDGVNCVNPGGSVVQALANLTGLYTDEAPATLLLKCDKSLCGGGAIQSHTVRFSQAATGTLEQAEPCPAKRTLGDGQAACVDYVQSTRDGSGDTLLYLLFTQDMRGSIG